MIMHYNNIRHYMNNHDGKRDASLHNKKERIRRGLQEFGIGGPLCSGSGLPAEYHRKGHR
jgi:hypothetical protein